MRRRTAVPLEASSYGRVSPSSPLKVGGRDSALVGSDST